MKQLGLDSHQQKLLVRKVFALIEKDSMLEYFKLRIERAGEGLRLHAAGQRAGKDIVACAEGVDFHLIVSELRDQIVRQLPKRPDNEQWIESESETEAWMASPMA